ncbi:MAG: SIS domain-containing protein [Elusimicrobia bacterium]|nr:SIS domain-containing protein [Elusimicrobiota bacterium]
MSASKRKISGTRPGATHKTGPGGLGAAAFARWYREETLGQWRGLDLEKVAELAGLVADCQDQGRQVFVVGNGGSAAAASHWATDLSKTAAVAGKPLVKCISLTDNVPFITAIGNDLSFDDIFSRQLENLVEPGDLVILISGSGNSKNLLKAAELANARGAKTAALLGFDGGKLKALAGLCILLPCDQYGVIEDLHMGIGHILTFYLKQRR